MPSQIILNLAISLDGYISDTEGGFSWIEGHSDQTLDTETQFDFNEFFKTLDVVVMGKSAYDDAPEGSLDVYDDKMIYVVTNSEEVPEKSNVRFIKGNVVSQILEIKDTIEKDIWIYGGAQLADLFIKADVIDEYQVAIIPCLLGSGRRLFLEGNDLKKLHLKQYIVGDGIVILSYTKR